MLPSPASIGTSLWSTPRLRTSRCNHTPWLKFTEGCVATQDEIETARKILDEMIQGLNNAKSALSDMEGLRNGIVPELYLSEDWKQGGGKPTDYENVCFNYLFTEHLLEVNNDMERIYEMPSFIAFK